MCNKWVSADRFYKEVDRADKVDEREDQADYYKNNVLIGIAYLNRDGATSYSIPSSGY